MKYVLDSNVGLKWVLSETDSDKARRLRDDFHDAIHELIAPDIFPVECLHALLKAERQRRIIGGLALWQTIMVDAPALVPHIPLLTRAAEIAAAARIGVYDCLYVALAEEEGCELVTADGPLAKNLQPSFSFIRTLATMP